MNPASICFVIPTYNEAENITKLLARLVELYPGHKILVVDDTSPDGTGELVIGTVVQGHEAEMPDAPPVHDVAGLGTIERFEKLPDGRFLIMLLGQQRVRLSERESPHSYRLVETIALEETPESPARVDDLRSRLTEAILSRSEELLNLPDNLPISCLADLLALRLNPPHATTQRLFAELDVERRADLALEIAGTG